MPEIVQDHGRLAVDDDGFLMNREDWTEEKAKVLAAREGLEHLSGEQLDILRFLRSYFREHGFFPIVRAVCKNVHQPRTCVRDQFIDPVTAWKIAGLPNPGEEVIGFRSWDPLGY
jgi:tRNA 2-thiouridine synthesizing protein E